MNTRCVWLACTWLAVGIVSTADGAGPHADAPKNVLVVDARVAENMRRTKAAYGGLEREIDALKESLGVESDAPADNIVVGVDGRNDDASAPPSRTRRKSQPAPGKSVLDDPRVITVGHDEVWYDREPAAGDDRIIDQHVEYDVPYESSYDSSYDSCESSCDCTDACDDWLCDPPRCPQLDVRLEYLHWWIKGYDVPALVTAGSSSEPLGDAGALGEPGTSVVFGQERISDKDRWGGRISFVRWLGDCSDVGLAGDLFVLDSQTQRYHVSSGGDPVVSRPYLDAQTGLQAAQPVAYPGEFSGSIDIRASTDLQSASALMRHALRPGEPLEIDFMYGYRFFRLGDELSLMQRSTAIGSGDTVTVTDDWFNTENQFHGGEFGWLFHARRGRLTCDVLTKWALGNNHESLTVRGANSSTPPGGPTTNGTGGLLAQPTNMGDFNFDGFSFIQEVGCTLRFDVNDMLRLSLGYSFVYWNCVIRPGEQIDSVINTSQMSGPLMGPARPRIIRQPVDFWAQGINLGCELTY